jgi:hypothetical protein
VPQRTSEALIATFEHHAFDYRFLAVLSVKRKLRIFGSRKVAKWDAVEELALLGCRKLDHIPHCRVSAAGMAV